MSATAATEGASQFSKKAEEWLGFSSLSRRKRASASRPKSARLILAEGRRGAHERNCVSNSFISFIRCSFQARFYFLQAITVTARGRIGRKLKQFADLFESVFMPNFQDDDFALLGRQFGQTTHRFALVRTFRG